MLENNDLIKKLKSSRHAVAYTGYEFSPITINDPETNYAGIPLKDILNLNFFQNNPEIFNKAYLNLCNILKNLSPSKAHYDLSELNLPIITENIDGLHKIAASKNTIELHGSLADINCTHCSYSYNLMYNKLDKIPLLCPICHNRLRPAVILFGEPLKNFHLALNEIYKSDLLIIFGSESKIWPANQIIKKALQSGCELIFI